MKVSRNLIVLLAVLLCHISGIRALELLPGQGKRAGNTASEAQALLTLSERQNYYDHTQALQTAQQALTLWEMEADNAGIARAFAQIGRCYFAQSELPEASENYGKALDLWRALNDPQEQAEVLIMLGYIESRKGEWSTAISFLTQALSLIEEKNDPFRMGQIANGLGDIFNESGSPENGLIQYQRALDYYRQTPDARDDTLTIWAIGSTHYLLGNYPESLTNLHQALAGVTPDSLDAALCHHYLGRVYSSMGENGAALQHLQSALQIYTNAVNPREAAQVRGLMGQIYQQQGQFGSARRYYHQALETFTKLSDRINQAVIYYALGQLELKNGTLDAAEEYLRQSIEVTENIRRVPTSNDLTVAFSAAVYERYERYIECLMQQHTRQPARQLNVRALETSEMARARSLAELLQATGTNLISGLDSQLAEREKSLRQSLRIKEDYKVTLLARAHKPEERADLEAELAQLEEEYKQVTETIRTRFPSYEQITRPKAWDLRQIQDQVIADDQTVLLEYSLGTDRSYVWAVTRTGITSYELPSQAQITEAAQKLYRLLSTPPGTDAANELIPAAQELGRMVLSPIAAELNKRRVIIVADSALNYIPFQALPVPSADNEPLVARYEVINAPSASILGELRQESARRHSASNLLAAFGDPVFASNYAQRKDSIGNEQVAALQALESEHWQQALRDVELNGDSFDPSAIKPLFYARRELANLRRVAAGRGTYIATDFAATREQLLSTDLAQYAILHLATHGILDPKRPENSGLVLSTIDRNGQAQNGFVGLQDIYQLRAPVDLVVLSACQTALGKDMRGEGLIGLTRGFMYAGASSVVASLWKVDDEATAELMRRFYNNMLMNGMTPAAALHAAQNSIRQEPQWRSPYYWAAFTLQGEYRENLKVAAKSASNSAWVIPALGAFFVISLIGAVWGYRRLSMKRARPV